MSCTHHRVQRCALCKCRLGFVVEQCDRLNMSVITYCNVSDVIFFQFTYPFPAIG